MNFALTFLDIDPALTAAWSRHLHTLLPSSRHLTHPRPNVVTDSLKSLDFAFDCIVSPGNSFARMDGGLDLLISRFFAEGRRRGGERERLGSVLRFVQLQHFRRWRGLQPVGSCYLIDMLPWMARGPGDDEVLLAEKAMFWNKYHCRYIAHSPTMRVPSLLWREEVVYECMWSVLNEIYNHNLAVSSSPTTSCLPAPQKIERVVVTGLGTGTGELDRDVCAHLMVLAYVNFLDALEAGEESQGEWRWGLAREWDTLITTRGGEKQQP
ncbi:uncharacterized protein V1518DRAFT_376844 [Limtongia smithiae]|uniref:uncharacterized protein n=1 Tax=Limtongia smithiae TaxID=1125753 RepID=UPI0034CF5DB2